MVATLMSSHVQLSAAISGCQKRALAEWPMCRHSRSSQKHRKLPRVKKHKFAEAIDEL
jgi:hypothetical protein